MSSVIGMTQVVESQLDTNIRALEEILGADCLTYFGPITYGVDDAIRDAIESLSNRQEKLVFILETGGGFAETARRIADTLRFHYRVVDFLVPSHAMSAGTILVMAGDAIHMDYYSVLGPIDPQVPGSDGRLIPALGYLIRYEELLDKANQGQVSTAEMKILLGFDQGTLYSYSQARDLSISLLKEWLVKYKFKDWNVTESSKIEVTPEMKVQRAEEIAAKLNDVRRWNSHGIGINVQTLRAELNLKIDDFGENPQLSDSVRGYHRLLIDYAARQRHTSILHTREAYRPLMAG